jgi:predicted  nucleic acid-binding Zn-ribbon protein
MQDTIKALRALQELDQEIYRLRDELRRLPEERGQRRGQIDNLIARKEETRKKGLDLRVKIKEIEDLTTIQRQRVRKVEHESATSRGDMALIAAFQHQVRTLKKDINQAEEEALTMMAEAETVEAEVKKFEAEIEQAEAVYAEFAKNVEGEIAVARRHLDELERQRATRMSPGIEPDSFALYEKLLSKREGVALAELEQRICQACFIQVPVNLYVRVARGNALVQCPSCDRIFYVRD